MKGGRKFDQERKELWRWTLMITSDKSASCLGSKLNCCRRIPNGTIPLAGDRNRKFPVKPYFGCEWKGS